MVSMLIVAIAVLTPLATSDGGIGPDFVGLYIGLVYIGSMAATQPRSHNIHTADIERRFRRSLANLLELSVG